MTTPSNPSELFSPFLPSTYTLPEDESRVKEYLGINLSGMSDVINDKKIGQYVDGNSLQNGEEWWFKSTKINRNGFQAMAYIQSLPNNTTTVLTLSTDPRFPIQDINSEFVITATWGDASKPPTTPGTGDYFSFMNRGDPRIIYDISDNSLTITTTVDLSGYSGFIVIEFLRRGT